MLLCHDRRLSSIGAWATLWDKRCFFMGILAALGWAPYNYLWATAVALNMLMIRLWFCKTSQEAAYCGWWWGWGLYIATLFWVGNSLWIEAHRFGWLWPFSFFVLPGIFAIYPALGALLVYQVKKVCAQSVAAYGFSFIGIWSLLEFAQGHLFTGFPWNLLAYIWEGYLPIAQVVSVAGSYGLGLVTLFLFCLPGIGILYSRYAFKLTLGVSLLCLAALYYWGQHRINSTTIAFHPDILLRVVQPCISQKEKGKPSYAAVHFRALVDMSNVHINEKSIRPTHVIWPEGGIPWSLSKASSSFFPTVIENNNSFTLLAGVPYYTEEGKLFNALIASENNASPTFVYAKRHLLPFGEYLPYRTFLSRWINPKYLKKITPGSVDFSFGPKVYTNQCKGLPPFRTLICYEAIFPGTITPRVISLGRFSRKEGTFLPEKLQARWILNITNDAWFGYSPGPYQHFASARFRAIEEGLPLVRAANNGISAIIDPFGRIVRSMELNFHGVMDERLPHCLDFTFYARFHDRIWVALMTLLALCVVQLIFFRRLKEKMFTKI